MAHEYSCRNLLPAHNPCQPFHFSLLLTHEYSCRNLLPAHNSCQSAYFSLLTHEYSCRNSLPAHNRTWEAIELIEHFVDSQSSVRSSRKPENINVSYAIWDGSCHKMGKARSHQQQFALWLVASEDLTNCCDPCGVEVSHEVAGW